MGGSKSKEPPPKNPLFDQPWRVLDWGGKEKLLNNVRKYKPDSASHVRILLYGPVGAGKSSFINSAATTVLERKSSAAEASAANMTTSFTTMYRTHKLIMKGNEKIKLPIVFNDLMGLEAEHNRGVRPEDIILAMKGHVKDKYEFNPHRSLTKENKEFYRACPTLDDRVHILVCMLDANKPYIHQSVIEKMTEVREAARNLGIPQVAIATHVDLVCEEIEKDLRNVFRSKVLKQSMEEFSTAVGVPMDNIFPVRNNYEGQQADEASVLMLTALKHMIDYVDDFFDEEDE